MLNKLLELLIEELGVSGWIIAAIFVLVQIGHGFYRMLVMQSDGERKDIEHSAQLLAALADTLTDDQKWFYADAVHDRHFRSRTKMKNVSAARRDTMMAFMRRHPELRWVHLRRLASHIERVDATQIRLIDQAQIYIWAAYAIAMWGALSVTFFFPIFAAVFKLPTTPTTVVQFLLFSGAWIGLAVVMAWHYVTPVVALLQVKQALKQEHEIALEPVPKTEPTLPFTEPA